MKAYLVILGLVLLSCGTKHESSILSLRDKYSKLDSIYLEREEFNDSICRVAMDSATRRFNKNKFELFAFWSMDSSETAIHILQNKFHLHVISLFADKDIPFRFCFNERMLTAFKEKYGFDPIDSANVIYDSLDRIGLTSIQPKFGNKHNDFLKYMICSLEFPDSSIVKAPFPTVRVSFRISPNGGADNVIITKSFSDKYDSAVLKVVRLMPRWTPGRGDDGKYQEQFIQWEFRFDPSEKEKYCR